MRVLHLLSSTGYHGAENMAAELIRQSALLGAENHIGVFRSGPQSNLELLDHVRDVASGSIIVKCRGQFDFSPVMALRRYLRNNRIDVVHSHKYKTNVYTLAASVGAGVGLVSTCHNWLGTSLRMRAYAALDKRVLRRFDIVAAVSADIARVLANYVSHDRIRQAPNGVDVARFGRTDRAAAKAMLGLEGRRVVGFVGRLSVEKGIEQLLRAVASVAQTDKRILALIVGGGGLRETLEQQVRELGIAEQVRFVGEQRDIATYYDAMDIFVLPSYNEGLPMAVLEAMASRVPVVASRVGEIPAVLDDGRCGWVVGAGSAKEIAAAIIDISDRPDAVCRAVELARERVERRYSSGAMAREYLQMYRDALCTDRNSRA